MEIVHLNGQWKGGGAESNHLIYNEHGSELGGERFLKGADFPFTSKEMLPSPA